MLKAMCILFILSQNCLGQVDNFDDLDFSGVVDIPEGYNKNLQPKNKNIVPYICIGVPLSDKKKFLSQSRYMQESLCKAYKQTQKDFGITESDIRRREEKEREEEMEINNLQNMVRNLKKEEQENAEQKLMKNLLKSSKQIGNALSGTSYINSDSSPVKQESKANKTSTRRSHKSFSNEKKAKPLLTNFTSPNCGPKPTPQLGYKVGSCIDGEWQIIAESSIVSAPKCGPKPTPQLGYKVGSCINGEWQVIAESSIISAPNCGPKPTPQLGYKVGKCISGEWQIIQGN
tara:strand:- start:247 stop:1110 length:864 start_codon:yes stop_codon:yes gene_type:complete